MARCHIGALSSAADSADGLAALDWALHWLLPRVAPEADLDAVPRITSAFALWNLRCGFGWVVFDASWGLDGRRHDIVHSIGRLVAATAPTWFWKAGAVDELLEAVRAVADAAAATAELGDADRLVAQLVAGGATPAAALGMAAAAMTENPVISET